MPEWQRLLMAGSWILAYTDTASIDSTNTVHYIRIPATECERKEPVSFPTGISYQVHLVCGQSIPGELIGEWSYSSDSIIGFGLKSDTLKWLSVTKLVMVTSDTLKLIQPSSLTAPDIQYTSFEEKTYSR
jgi:hypothetical protein